MELLQLLSQQDGQELVGRLGDGNLVRFVFGCAIGACVGALIGWTFPQPEFIKRWRGGE